jgi:Lar family restriction alleviation protein
MSDDLKPCPFCGGELGITTSFDHEQGDKWGYASCGECAARGPEVRTQYAREHDAPWHYEAIAAWNTRTKTKAEQAFDQQIADYVKRGKP